MKRKFCYILCLVLVAIISTCTFFLISEIISDKKEEKLFEIISEKVDESNAYSNDRLAELYIQNNDFVGWLSIPDTVIDYPVMQTKDKPNYYLCRNFNKEYSRYGTPYLQENCDISKSDNLIVYGHNMKTKMMFYDLSLYQDISFYEKHKLVYFDTQENKQTYEIFAVFKTVAYTSNSFQYNTFVNATDENEFREYVKTCKSLSLYDTGLSAEYGDKLLTLSTCDYSTKDGRLVIVAKKV